LYVHRVNPFGFTGQAEVEDPPPLAGGLALHLDNYIKKTLGYNLLVKYKKMQIFLDKCSLSA